MRELLFQDRLTTASSEILGMLSEFIDINTLFVAINDKKTNRILKAINRSEVLVVEGELPFVESYCSLVSSGNEAGILVIPDTMQHVSTASMKFTCETGATTFIGVPILANDNEPIGTVCGIDRKPYGFDKREIKLLQMAAKFLTHVIELENLAFRDVLTGAYTRNYLDGIWPMLTTEHKTFAVCVIDLDNFKRINDSYGHLLGDRVLTFVSKQIQAQLSAQDELIRIGGDEFVVIRPDYGSESELIQFLKQVVSAFCTIDNPVPNAELSISVGVSLYPRDGRDVEVLIEKADAAMYQVKISGKNNYSIVVQAKASSV